MIIGRKVRHRHQFADRPRTHPLVGVDLRKDRIDLRTVAGDFRNVSTGERVGVFAAAMTTNDRFAPFTDTTAGLATSRDVQPCRGVAKGNDAAKHGGEQGTKQHGSVSISSGKTELLSLAQKLQIVSGYDYQRNGVRQVKMVI